MATFFGAAVNPADSAAYFDTASPVAITPPASMAANDLVYCVVAEYDGGSMTHSVAVDGGQTWTAGTQRTDGTVGGGRSFWTIFNGTWGANPSFATSRNSEFNDFSALMLVFRPTSGAHVWSVDQTESYATYAAPGGSFDVTPTGHTTAGASGIAIATYISGLSNITWANQSGGTSWANPGGAAQWRNTANAQQTLSALYKLLAAPGATGNPTNRQSAAEAGWTLFASFKETAPTAKFPRLLYG